MGLVGQCGAEQGVAAEQDYKVLRWRRWRLLGAEHGIVMFLSDMSGRSPLYKNSPVHKELVAQIKKDSSVLPRIGALSEMNLEFFAIDSQEFPRVHYRVAKTIDASTMTTLRDLVPTKLAASVWNCLEKYKTTIPEFPQTETCELLIVDRSIDQIAPIIHEWTYDAMCHDLLCMDGNKYVHEVPSKNGPATEKKEVLLEDHDPVWLELRHAHIADASERLHDKMTNFISKNKAAQLHQARNGGELSTRDLQKMVQALPQYSDQIDKLSLHVEPIRRIASMASVVDPAAPSTFSAKIAYVLAEMERINCLLDDYEARLVALEMAGDGASSAIQEVSMVFASPLAEAVPRPPSLDSSCPLSTSTAKPPRKKAEAGGIRGGNEVPATAVKVASGVDIREARALDIGAWSAVAGPLLGPCPQHLFAGRITCLRLLQPTLMQKKAASLSVMKGRLPSMESCSLLVAARVMAATIGLLGFCCVGCCVTAGFHGLRPLFSHGVSRENKLRLLMIYAALNPEKFESDKGAKLMQLAGLSADDMIAVNNMRCLCGPETKKSSGGGFTLKFDVHKELIEKLSKGELPKDEYNCMSDPSPSAHGLPTSSSVRTSPAHSMRSRRTGGTWARPRGSDDGYSSDSVLKHASSDFKKLGQRIFVFVIGGATRSELRAAHMLSSKLKREIILGSSSLDDPPQFITKLKLMSAEELTLDDLQI
nr:unnamed protein product [Digitaria exilis]